MWTSTLHNIWLETLPSDRLGGPQVDLLDSEIRKQKAKSSKNNTLYSEFLCFNMDNSFIRKLTSTVSKISAQAKESRLSRNVKDLLTVFLCSPRELKEISEHVLTNFSFKHSDPSMWISKSNYVHVSYHTWAGKSSLTRQYCAISANSSAED